MSEFSPRGTRKYLGLAVVVVAFFGGIAGWSYAVISLDSSRSNAFEPVSNDSYGQLLRQFVDSTGRVDYAGLYTRSDSLLTPYLETLAETDLEGSDRDARLAFWINAYNALTVKLILDHYPLQNIWAITPGPPEPKEESPFEIEVGAVADTMRTLDEIEHEIIRKRFDEPRIHFALVCAAESCPPLRREPFDGSDLDAQLDEQARTFLHNDAKNQIPADSGQIALSRILKWYGDDFGETEADLQQYLSRYFDGDVADRLQRASYQVTYRSYDWSLNAQKKDGPVE